MEREELLTKEEIEFITEHNLPFDLFYNAKGQSIKSKKEELIMRITSKD